MKPKMTLPTTQPTHADIAWHVREIEELRAENLKLRDALILADDFAYAHAEYRDKHHDRVRALVLPNRARISDHDPK